MSNGKLFSNEPSLRFPLLLLPFLVCHWPQLVWRDKGNLNYLKFSIWGNSSACQSGELETIQSAQNKIIGKQFPECWKNISEVVKPPWEVGLSPVCGRAVPAELQQCSRSCLGCRWDGSRTWPPALGWELLLEPLLPPVLPGTVSALGVLNCCISEGMVTNTCFRLLWLKCLQFFPELLRFSLHLCIITHRGDDLKLCETLKSVYVEALLCSFFWLELKWGETPFLAPVHKCVGDNNRLTT